MTSGTQDYSFPEPFKPVDLEAGLGLSRMASWNQTIEDWQTFYSLGRLRTVITEKGGIAATIGVLPLGRAVSWISLVLVSPEHRRRGLASRMMEWAVDCAREENWTAMLDATEAGSHVYQKIGFRVKDKIYRCVVTAGSPEAEAPGDAMETISVSNVPDVISWHHERSGLDQGPLFTHWLESSAVHGLISRNPGGGITGYSFSRPGYHAPQIGPVFAEAENVAQSHVAAHLALRKSSAVMDLTQAGMQVLQSADWLSLEIKRDFLRMGLEGKGPGIPGNQMAIAGPEFG